MSVSRVDDRVVILVILDGYRVVVLESRDGDTSMEYGVSGDGNIVK